ncbi:MAG TPA: flagellar filament capping protein FliD [Geminicoccaceae bacterium]|nr:flagellar filament capping protein FliD [Geminicoccaceae bacterium]
MATNLNFDSLVIDGSGRASFSGLGTGIDIQKAVDGLIAAKRIPIDRIEQRITDNQVKVAAFQDLRALATNLKNAVDRLRGVPSFDGATDVFRAKQVFATASRTDAQTPSQAAEIVGVAVTNRSESASHTIEVRQIAAAHKVASATIAGGLNDALGQSGSFVINGRTITIDAADSLLALRVAINAANTGDEATGVTASIVSISTTEQVLILTADKTGTDATISAVDASGSVLQSLGVLDGGGAFANELQAAQNAELLVDGLGTPIERQSNTIDDVFGGVTLSLFKAEPGTTIKLDVERDLNQVKSAIVDLVDAYNELRRFINQQALRNVPEDDESGAGILAGTSALSEIRARLSAAIGGGVQGDDPALTVLAQVGISFRSPGKVADPLLANTLEIDEAKLDEALLNRADAVRELFAFEMSSSSPNVTLLGFGADTRYSASGYQLNVAYSGGAITSANLGGAADGSDDGSVVVEGNVLTVVSGPAKGLRLLYTGKAPASGIQLDVSVGLAAQIYDTVDALTKERSGLIASEITSLESQNELSTARVERLEERLERERERLLERFIAMETALATMNRLLESLRQQIDASFGDRRN